MVGSIEKTFDWKTKTLRVKWKLENYLQLRDYSLRSGVITTDEYPDKWQLEIFPNGVSDKDQGHLSLYLHKEDGCDAKVDLNFKICDVVLPVCSNVYGCNRSGFAQFMTHDQVMASLINETNLELVMEITYFSKFDQLTVVYDEKNAMKVNWTIIDFKQRLHRHVQYSSDDIACSDYPDALWKLKLSRGSVILAKGNEGNNVEIAAALKLNGQDTAFQPQKTRRAKKKKDSRLDWTGAISLKELRSSGANDLVIEVVIVFQVIENTRNTSIECKADLEPLKTGDYSDFTIKVQAVDGTIDAIPVHRCILAPRWVYFKTMLRTGLDEAKNSEMVIRDFDVTTVKNLIKYLYCRSTSVSDVKSALNLLKMAHRYELVDLFDLCVKFVCKYLGVDYVVETLMSAKLYESKDLIAACKKVLEKEGKPIGEYSGYLKLKAGDELDILKSLFQSVFVK